MTLIQIIGDVGSGKTLFAVRAAKLDTRPVYANFNIKLGTHKNKKRKIVPRFSPLKPETLLSLKDDSLVIIDEAYIWLESRLSGRNINLYLSYILFQSRKRGIDIILTNQLSRTIDVRFRLMTNLEVYCQQVESIGFEYTFVKKSDFQYFKPKTFILPYEEAEKFYKIYDSWELIIPFDDNLMLNISTDKGDMLKIVDDIVKAIVKEINPKRCTRGVVSNYCLRNNHPKGLVGPVYDTISSIARKNP